MNTGLKIANLIHTDAMKNGPLHVAIIWTKFLPYHVARINHLRKRLSAEGHRLTAIEVASKDALYPFPEQQVATDDYVCIFSGRSYRALSPMAIHTRIYSTIERLAPDVVISPSTPFPSGMAAIKYCLRNNKFSAIMDDAWQLTDTRGWLIASVKKIIHKIVDAAFIPSAFHASYYERMGFPSDRIVVGVDVVDNDFYSRHSHSARERDNELRRELQLPKKYFIFVGRFIKRKGIETLLKAFRHYRSSTGSAAWDLVLVGDGIEIGEYKMTAQQIDGVHFSGAHYGEKLCAYYGLAKVMIIPSDVETWGLVVNEAMASRLPVIATSGCGAARALIEEGKNGWMFQPRDHRRLSQLMTTVSSLPDDELKEKGEHAFHTIQSYSLETFSTSALSLFSMTQRNKNLLMPNIVTRLWPGRISFYP
ncbi:MAG: glycosyltransferase family 4 protein [Ignavibacteriales bacterium]|nr:glycosyltransferase family 4 protein [Ignavibacteriales bacterium]